MSLVFLFLPLLSALGYLLLAHQFAHAAWFSHVINSVLIGLTLYYLLNFTAPITLLHFSLLDLKHVALNLNFALDKLSLSMLLLISTINLIVNRFAFRYVYADLNRTRFMFQLGLVTFSVIFLVLSANLLTAFIGWQLIGFNLYWLLNHYHYDEQANRAAKKKFIINRIGDISFFFSVILCLYYYSSTEFQVLFNLTSPTITFLHYTVPARSIILAGIFIAVMTKSAQFPFHIWLPDTMQTPTPVSAMMHAGVINAGGYLLARLGAGIVLSPGLLLGISLIGFITLLLGNLFITQQADVKKQLAYSTMAQMGYMVLQCGLGFFAGAIFHLIAHGFFKAWSFLTSGSLLPSAPKTPQRKSTLFTCFISFLLCAVIFGLALLMSAKFYRLMTLFPLLSVFLVITLYELVANSILQKIPVRMKLYSLAGITGLFWIYLLLTTYYESFTRSTFPVIAQAFNIHWQIVGMIITLSFWIIHRVGIISLYRYKTFTDLHNLIRHKLFIEEMYRYYLLEPLRDLGDVFYAGFKRYQLISLLMMLAILLAVLGVNFKWHVNAVAYAIALFIIVSLITANRARQLKHIFILLIGSHCALAIIALRVMSVTSTKIAYFQFIHITLLCLLMMLVLYKIKSGKKLVHAVENNLPWLGAYLTAILFCFIGLPFTAAFISETIILKELIAIQPGTLLLLLIAIMLSAITVLHTLQDSIFKASAIQKLSVQLSPLDHFLFISILFFNLINGVYPEILLKIL
ncbi:MAG: hypothetical protein KIT27_09570 [Legionellales bacterium]|nr:hypothetical protein [Legionellales bacterium]